MLLKSRISELADVIDLKSTNSLQHIKFLACNNCFGFIVLILYNLNHVFLLSMKSVDYTYKSVSLKDL